MDSLNIHKNMGPLEDFKETLERKKELKEMTDSEFEPIKVKGSFFKVNVHEVYPQYIP